MPVYRNRHSERKFSLCSTSSVELRKIVKVKKRVRQPRRLKKRSGMQRDNGSNKEWKFVNQDGDKIGFETSSQLAKNFSIIQGIGAGGFGTVVKVKHNIVNGFYAIKCILVNLMDDQFKNIKKEAELLSSLDNENIVRYYGTWIDDCTIEVDEEKTDDEESEEYDDSRRPNNDTGESSNAILFRNGSNVSDADPPPKSGPRKVLCIQMEFCKSTLSDVINSNNLYKKPWKAWKIFWEIVRGLAYVHKRNLIHRDLKPQNIFLTKEDRVKIGDFGLATKIFRGASVLNDLNLKSLSAEVGTSLYRAPELECSGTRAKYGQEIDIYSLGIILFEMFHPPFGTGSERIHILNDLRKKEILFPAEFERDENATLICLLRTLLNHETSARPTCVDLQSQKSKQPSINKKPQQDQLVKKKYLNPFQQPHKLNVFYDHLGNANTEWVIKIPKFGGNVTDTRGVIEREVIIAPWRGNSSNVFKKFPQQRTPDLASTAGPIQAVTVMEVKKALLQSISGTLPDTRQTTKSLKCMVVAFNRIIKNGKMPDIWNMIGLKSESNGPDYEEYLIAMYLSRQSWEELLATRLEQLLTPIPFRYTTQSDAIVAMVSLCENFRSLRKDVHVILITLENELVPRKLIWTALRAQNIPEKYIELIKKLYTNGGVRVPWYWSKKTYLMPGVLQGSTLGPLLFITAVHYITRDIINLGGWTMLFANKILLASESIEELQRNLSMWCNRLESGGLRVRRRNPAYIYSKFSKDNNDTRGNAMTLDNTSK